MKTYVVEYQDPRDGNLSFTFYKSDAEGDKLTNKVKKSLKNRFSYWTSFVSIYSIELVEDWVKSKIERATEI